MICTIYAQTILNACKIVVSYNGTAVSAALFNTALIPKSL